MGQGISAAAVPERIRRRRAPGLEGPDELLARSAGRGRTRGIRGAAAVESARASGRARRAGPEDGRHSRDGGRR